jgi:hypothetical protein
VSSLEPDKRTALHEAVHAVIGLFSGLEIETVLMHPPRVIAHIDACSSEASAARVRFLVAPCAAQLVFGADDGLEHDLERARAVIATLHEDDPQRYIEARLAEAKKLVIAHQPTIEAVAAELLKAGELRGARVRQLMAQKRAAR